MVSEKAYGSGHFGEWFEDEFGLPAYRYTCDQENDPKARTPVNTTWRSPTDHTHQVGNDRLVAAVSNYGYVQVRQDEGAPKFLNDYDPPSGQYGGGFGYLTDGEVVLSTLYPNEAETFERIFGTGYFRKRVAQGPYVVDQVILAPYGDDPLLLSQVTVTNRGDRPADLRWVEYWGCRPHQFSYRQTLLAYIRKDFSRAAAERRRFDARFAHRFQPLPGGAGLLDVKHFQGRLIKDELAWGLVQVLLATVGREASGGAVRAPVRQAGLEDLNPPTTFLASLDAPADGWSTDGRAFFGAGGPARPDGLHRAGGSGTALDGNLACTGRDAAMLLERRLRLEPGESRTLYFAFGYLARGVELQSLLARYQAQHAGVWARSSAAWRADGLRLSVSGQPWVERETCWHHYYLRSSLTYDDFFGEHILSQGHVYQYLMGFQGAARDPLQHALPFVFSAPRIVKEVLRYTLKEVQPDGRIPYGITGHGMVMPGPFAPSDLELWLLWLASEYVLATRDRAFLDEKVATYPVYGPRAPRERAGALLARCFQHLVKATGTGEHGLLRLSNGDWNDGAVIGHVPKEHRQAVRARAESVLNAAMAIYVFEHYARLLDYVGQPEAAAEARAWAEKQRAAVRAQWAGRWFRRAWLTPELGWLGDDILWLEPQPWALIGGAATPEQARTLVEAIDELVRRPSPIGAMLLSRCLEQMEVEDGVLTNAGIWPSINGTLVWALAGVDGALAWDEWQKNSLARHAESYPDVWYGVWSGPDSYNSVLSKFPGQTQFQEELATGVPSGRQAEVTIRGLAWTDWPVMNLHPHAWQLYSAAKLLGIEFTPEGVALAPALPCEGYRFTSPLLGLIREGSRYEGWYAPTAGGTWRITLRLPERERAHLAHLEVNGTPQPIEPAADGAIAFAGPGGPEQPLRWTIM